MTVEEFKYWLLGYFMLSTDTNVTAKQLRLIKQHANLVHAVSGSMVLVLQQFCSQVESAFAEQDVISFLTFKTLADQYLYHNIA